jgi:hypoxanthine phosphoribosyltransferase
VKAALPLFPINAARQLYQLTPQFKTPTLHCHAAVSSYKIYISPETLLTNSYELALNIYESGYRPDFIVGIWRGGSPIGIAIHEMLSYLGVHADHVAIRATSYIGIGEQGHEVNVYGLDYLENKLEAHHQVLLVDDVFDSGNTLYSICSEIAVRCKKNSPHVKIATPYFKPSNNKTPLHPDFYLYSASDWLVFPHELQGLSLDEILQNKSALTPLASRFKNLIGKV